MKANCSNCKFCIIGGNKTSHHVCCVDIILTPVPLTHVCPKFTKKNDIRKSK